MQSHGSLNRAGLTFSINDVNFDTNSLDLVPIINKPEPDILKPKKKVDIDFVSYLPNVTISSTKSIDYSYNQSISNQEIKTPVFDRSLLLSEVKNNFESVYSKKYLNPNKMDNNLQSQLPIDMKSSIINNYDNVNTHYESVTYHWYYCVVINGLAEWKPFSIKDSNRIEMKYCKYFKNGSSYEVVDDCIPTDGGRYDVFIHKRQKVSVYWEEAPMEIRRASWFYRPEDESFYLPYSELECDQLEEKFKYILENNLWHQPFELNDNLERCLEDKFVFHSANTMVEYRKYGYLSSEDNITKGRIVYRGVEGFKNHLEPGESDNIDHIMFVVHGIGSVCDMGGRGIIECVKTMRNISDTMLKSHFSHHEGRIELLPVSWHNKFHNETMSVDKDFSKISLKSVPKLRNFTNKTLVDVLCYSSATYCQTILTIVAAEMNRLRHLFMSRNPQYDGTISIAGHSLGAMIAFDLICLQENDSNTNLVPILDSSAIPALEFDVGHLFALGSPISLLLTARGNSFLGDHFQLPACKGFFNIFHPFDPVAYRMEPMLIQHCNTRPVVIPHHKGRKRLHLELKENIVRVSQDIKSKLFQTLKSTWSSLQEFATAHKTNLIDDLGDDDEMMSVLNKIDNNIGDRDDMDMNISEIVGSIGLLNGGRRVDFVLQEAPLESFNDYLFALGSHACYWDSEDTVLMMLKEIYITLNISPVTRSSDMLIANILPHQSHNFPTITNTNQRPPLMPMVSPSPSFTSSVLPPTFNNLHQKSFFQPKPFSEKSLEDKVNLDKVEEKMQEKQVNKKEERGISDLFNENRDIFVDRPPHNIQFDSENIPLSMSLELSNISSSNEYNNGNDIQISYPENLSKPPKFYQHGKYVKSNDIIEFQSESYQNLSQFADITLNQLPSNNQSQSQQPQKKDDLMGNFYSANNQIHLPYQISTFSPTKSFQPRPSTEEEICQKLCDDDRIQSSEYQLSQIETISLQTSDDDNETILSTKTDQLVDKSMSKDISYPPPMPFIVLETKMQEEIKSSTIPSTFQPTNTFLPGLCSEEVDQPIDFCFTSFTSNNESQQQNKSDAKLNNLFTMVQNGCNKLSYGITTIENDQQFKTSQMSSSIFTNSVNSRSATEICNQSSTNVQYPPPTSMLFNQTIMSSSSELQDYSNAIKTSSNISPMNTQYPPPTSMLFNQTIMSSSSELQDYSNAIKTSSNISPMNTQYPPPSSMLFNQTIMSSSSMSNKPFDCSSDYPNDGKMEYPPSVMNTFQPQQSLDSSNNSSNLKCIAESFDAPHYSSTKPLSMMWQQQLTKSCQPTNQIMDQLQYSNIDLTKNNPFVKDISPPKITSDLQLSCSENKNWSLPYNNCDISKPIAGYNSQFVPMFQQSNVSDFDSLFHTAQPHSNMVINDMSRPSRSPSSLIRDNSNAISIDSRTKLKSNQELSEYCGRTPSPRVPIIQNIRHSPKNIAMTSSVFGNMKPLTPQSGKLFKKK